jgi:hypothetical protein
LRPIALLESVKLGALKEKLDVVAAFSKSLQFATTSSANREKWIGFNIESCRRSVPVLARLKISGRDVRGGVVKGKGALPKAANPCEVNGGGNSCGK